MDGLRAMGQIEDQGEQWKGLTHFLPVSLITGFTISGQSLPLSRPLFPCLYSKGLRQQEGTIFVFRQKAPKGDVGCLGFKHWEWEKASRTEHPHLLVVIWKFPPWHKSWGLCNFQSSHCGLGHLWSFWTPLVTPILSCKVQQLKWEIFLVCFGDKTRWMGLFMLMWWKYIMNLM